jgi:hypothetical protein
MTGTTLAGKCRANSRSHLGHELAAALACAGVDRARISDSAMSFLINSLNFCRRQPTQVGSKPSGYCDSDMFTCFQIRKDLNQC